MTRLDKAKIGAYILIVVAMIIAVYSVQKTNSQQLYQNQLAACERGNLLRSEVSEKTDDIGTLTKIIISNLKAAESADAKSQPTVLIYEKNIRKLEKIKSQPLQQLDCLTIIDQP